MTVTAGDAITFRWSRGTHNVWIYPSGTCDPSGGVEIGSINDNPTTYVFPENLAGSTVTFACEVGSHCDAGMLMNVTVLAPPPPVVPDDSIPSSNMTDSDFDDKIGTVNGMTKLSLPLQNTGSDAHPQDWSVGSAVSIPVHRMCMSIYFSVTV